MVSRSEKKQLKSEQKRKRNTMILGVLMIGLMVVSIVSIGRNTSTTNSNKFSYNGFNFEAKQVENEGVIFFAEQNDVDLGYFYYPPQDTEIINLSENLSTHIYQRKPLVITAKPLGENEVDINRVYLEMRKNDLSAASRITVISAKTEEGMYDDSPLYDCKDATPDLPVIKYIKDEIGTASIRETEYDDCYEIKGSGTELFKLRDKLIYVALGVQQ